MNNDSGFEVIRIVNASDDMPPEKVALIARRFAEHLHIQGYTIEQETDKSLIGGYVIYAQGTKYDYSYAGQLARIGRHLKTDRGNDSVKLEDGGEADEIHKSLMESLRDFDERPASLFEEDALWEDDAEEQTEKRENLLTEFAKASEVEQVGKVISVSDGVATVSGLENCVASELIMFSETSYGIAMNLETDTVGVVLLNECRDVECVTEPAVRFQFRLAVVWLAVLWILWEIRSMEKALSVPPAAVRSSIRHRVSWPDLRSASRFRQVLPLSTP